MSKLRICVHSLLLVFLAACSPAASAPTLPSQTTIPSQTSVPSQTSTPSEEFAIVLQTGRRFSDPADDIEISFLDVVGFEATVNEETELLEVVFQMRDVPETATHRQVRNVAEYRWRVAIFLDLFQSASPEPDFTLLVMTLETDPPTLGQEVLVPKPGEPETVPIDELWDAELINNPQGDYIPGLDVVADPDLNTITLRAPIPGITSKAVVTFLTGDYDGGVDQADTNVPSEAASLATPLPNGTAKPQTTSNVPSKNDPAQLIPAGTVRAYPGPAHYAGDMLTFDIVTDGSQEGPIDVDMTLDDRPPRKISGNASFMGILLPRALDTTSLTGQHTVTFTTADGALNETYTFEVLPAEQRPANETSAIWTTSETDCCIFHYLSDTAAARDIDFISEHFQKGADELENIMQEEIQSKMDVYIIDRILFNGGFGGGGKLLISYTDRYFGPTLGAAGLETLARHEFSHAADISLEGMEDGIEFNYEGLAVYVADGHYKPEPLAQRGAALFDLGHSLPVDQFIPQHELSYLHAALILTYIVETYGEDKLWEFLKADDTQDGQMIPLGDAIRSTFGISLEEFDRGFQAWLENNDPGEQLDDLRLTIELQDLRRQYQDTYSAQPRFLLLEEVQAVARREYRTIVMREARAPANIAVELIIADAQRAIIEGDYTRAEELNKILAEVMESGRLEHPIAKEYLEIVLAAASSGYEVVDLEIQGDRAETRVTAEPPALVDLLFQKANGTWQIQQ